MEILPLLLIPFLFTLITLLIFSGLFFKIRELLFKYVIRNKIVLGLIIAYIVISSIYYLFTQVSFEYSAGNVSKNFEQFTSSGYEIVGTIFVLIGAAMNWLMIMVYGAMHVYLGKQEIPKINDSKLHFFFNYRNVNKVRLFYLCDFISICKRYNSSKPKGKYQGVFSLGDLLIFYGLTLFLIKFLEVIWLGMM